MHRFYPIVFIVVIYLTYFIKAQRQENGTVQLKCPNYSYKCPDCKEGQFCSYPMSHGCEGSGVPVCQSKCPGIICAGKALPCPDDCPFSCEYHGPPCCPFIGQPTCLPPCETFVPCEVTPCPDDCPNDCFYPNADYCCPHSGQPICRSQLDVGSSQQNKYVKRGEILPSDSMPDETNDISHDSNSPALPDSALDPINDNRNSPICIDMIVPCPPECPNDCEYPAGVPCPLTHPPKCRSTINAGQTGYTDRKNHDSAIEKFSVLADEIVDIVGEEVKVMSQWEQLLAHQYNLLEWIYQQRKSLTSAHHIVPSHKSPITTTTTSTTTTTTIRLPSSKICPMIYVPCPELCPTTCIRPSDVPCPLAVPGYCP